MTFCPPLVHITGNKLESFFSFLFFPLAYVSRTHLIAGVNFPTIFQRPECLVAGNLIRQGVDWDGQHGLTTQ